MMENHGEKNRNSLNCLEDSAIFFEFVVLHLRRPLSIFWICLIEIDLE